MSRNDLFIDMFHVNSLSFACLNQSTLKLLMWFRLCRKHQSEKYVENANQSNVRKIQFSRLTRNIRWWPQASITEEAKLLFLLLYLQKTKKCAMRWYKKPKYFNPVGKTAYHECSTNIAVYYTSYSINIYARLKCFWISYINPTSFVYSLQESVWFYIDRNVLFKILRNYGISESITNAIKVDMHLVCCHCWWKNH